MNLKILIEQTYGKASGLQKVFEYCGLESKIWSTAEKPVFDAVFEEWPTLFIGDLKDTTTVRALDRYKIKYRYDIADVKPAADIFIYNRNTPNNIFACDLAYFGSPNSAVYKIITEGKKSVRIFSGDDWNIPQNMGTADDATKAIIYASAQTTYCEHECDRMNVWASGGIPLCDGLLPCSLSALPTYFSEAIIILEKFGLSKTAELLKGKNDEIWHSV